MLVAITGIAIGLTAAYALSRLLAALLFGIQPRDRLPASLSLIASTTSWH